MELNLLQLHPNNAFQFLLVILKGAHFSVQAFGISFCPGCFLNSLAGCFKVMLKDSVIYPHPHSLLSLIPCPLLSFFCLWISFLIPTLPHTSNSGRSNLTDGTVTSSSSDLD